VGVPFQHSAADVSGNRHDGAVRRSALRKLCNGAVPEVMEPESRQPLLSLSVIAIPCASY